MTSQFQYSGSPPFVASMGGCRIHRSVRGLAFSAAARLWFLALVLFNLYAFGTGAEPLPNPSSAGASPPWSASNWVIVVTWYDKSLDWLAEAPLQALSLRVVLFVKQDDVAGSQSCSAVPTWLRPHVVLCR